VTVKADFGPDQEAPISIRVSCIVRTERPTPQHRIRAIGGIGRDGRAWRLSEEAAVAAIAHERAAFYVERPTGEQVSLTVGLGRGRLYLRSRADRGDDELLLSLPDCTEG
jgi:hypothetical protein